MKKILPIMIIATLVLTSSFAYAKSENSNQKNENKKIEQPVQTSKQDENKKAVQNDQLNGDQKSKEYQDKEVQQSQDKDKQQNQFSVIKGKQQEKTNNSLNENITNKEKKESFKLAGSPLIKYGKVVLPIRPLEKGLGAKIAYDSLKHIITVTKGDTIIVIDLVTNKTTINGKEVQNSFNSKDKNNMTVLVKFIAQALGARADVKVDEVVITAPTPTPAPVPTVSPAPAASPAPTAAPTGSPAATPTPAPTTEPTPTPAAQPTPTVTPAA